MSTRCHAQDRLWAEIDDYFRPYFPDDDADIFFLEFQINSIHIAVQERFLEYSMGNLSKLTSFFCTPHFLQALKNLKVLWLGKPMHIFWGRMLVRSPILTIAF